MADEDYAVGGVIGPRPDDDDLIPAILSEGEAFIFEDGRVMRYIGGRLVVDDD